MTETDVQNLLKHNPNEMIDIETGLTALAELAKTAEKDRVSWAIVGGAAMYLYGSPRLTKDVDVIADKILSGIKSERPLGFGGERYQVQIKNKTVDVDWIVRNDEAKQIYQAALQDAILMEGIPVITTEWLIVLKYIAGRFKDQEDAVFLLRKKNLVSRKKIRANLKKVLGDNAWIFYRVGLQRWYDIADGVITTETEDYNPKARIE
ncbi:hypothetical protein BH20ACI4_BH20ACI4_24150 [soil metagenome]